MSKEIQIEGFTRKQSVLADIIWNLQSREAFDSFVSTLPPADQRDAWVVADMILWAYVDQVTEVTEEVKDMIQRISK